MKNKTEWQSDLEFVTKLPFKLLIYRCKGHFTLQDFKTESMTLEQVRIIYQVVKKKVSLDVLVQFALRSGEEYARWKCSPDSLIMWDKLVVELKDDKIKKPNTNLGITIKKETMKKLDRIISITKKSKSKQIEMFIKLHYSHMFRTHLIK